MCKLFIEKVGFIYEDIIICSHIYLIIYIFTWPIHCTHFKFYIYFYYFIHTLNLNFALILISFCTNLFFSCRILFYICIINRKEIDLILGGQNTMLFVFSKNQSILSFRKIMISNYWNLEKIGPKGLCHHNTHATLRNSDRTHSIFL